MTHISLVYDVLCWQLLGPRVRFFVSYGRKRTVPIPQLVAPPTQIVNPAPQFVIATKACGLRSGIDCSSAIIGHSRHPFVIPASQSSFRRRPESRGVGRGECSAVEDFNGAERGVAESAVPIRRTKPQLQLFIPWCAGNNRPCYESMCRTPIRDRLLQQPLIGHSRHPFVNPASFRRSKACPVPRYGAGIQRGGEG